MKLHREESGQAIVIVAASALALLMAIAVAMGAGQLYGSSRSAENAADAAAVAAAIAMFQQGTDAQIEAAARDDATRNGYTDGVDGVEIDVNRPPASGPFAGDDLYVEVVIRVPVGGLFLLKGPETITARAVASPLSAGPDVGVLALAPTGTGLDLSGSSVLTVEGADLLVASADAVAARTQGSSTVSVTAPREILIAGGVSGGGFQPAPRTNAVFDARDPFAGYPPPDPALHAVRSCCTALLDPGVYPGGIHTRGEVVLRPGIYILQGGGLSLRGGSARLRGRGVLIYNTVSADPADPGCGPLEFQSNDFDLEAATSGIYQGLLIWQDRACTEAMELRGNASGRAVGTIYLPEATLDMGGRALDLRSAVVAKHLVLGQATVTVRYDRASNAREMRSPALVE